QLVWARAVAEAAEVSDGRAVEIRQMLDHEASVPEGLALDADLRWMLLTALAATGHASVTDGEHELSRDDTASGRTAALRVRSAIPSAEGRAVAWQSAWNDLALSNDHLDATISGFRAGGRRDLIESFDVEYFERIVEVWQTRSIEIARRLVLGMFPSTPNLDL